MGDCLRTGEPPGTCIINTMVNLAFHPFGVGKSSTGLSGLGSVWALCFYWVAGNVASDAK